MLNCFFSIGNVKIVLKEESQKEETHHNQKGHDGIEELYHEKGKAKNKGASHSESYQVRRRYNKVS